ncbi:hypothetical protein Micbo1qcDRAFT_199829 [Microdochium bolleyi]|uniref:DUF7707 domain-containing protein n=1 Tax=Microdochium bolleyi TaxID=196109 RepID=A0A136JIW5_9PEZI|nr:hypothetical protein Micbo1qcDRAFT_199829 [Microdochium bolleyi]
MATLPNTWGLDANQVPISDRRRWCQDQMASCNIVCGAARDNANDCDYNTFAYRCQCASGKEPEMSRWTNTMPTYLCSHAAEVCINAAIDEAGRQRCRDNIQSKCSTRAPNPLDLIFDGTTTTGVMTSVVWTKPTASSTSQLAATASAPSVTTFAAESSMTRGPIIAGAVVGAVVFIIAVAGLFYWLGSRRRKRSSEEDQRRRERGSPQPSHPKPSESTLAGSDGFPEDTTMHKSNSRRASTIDKEVIGGSNGSSSGSAVDEKSDGFKTLITEKAQGHEMIRDLSATSPLDDDKYFDTAKYRMPPPPAKNP